MIKNGLKIVVIYKNPEHDEEREKSEHSSLEDFDESDKSIASDSTDSGNKNKGTILDFLQTVCFISTLLFLEENVTPSSPIAKPFKKPRATAKKGPFQCSNCKRSYQQKSSLTSHLKFECGAEAQFPCTMCECRFKRKPNLQRHLITIHQVDRNQLDKHGAGKKMFIFITYVQVIFLYSVNLMKVWFNRVEEMSRFALYVQQVRKFFQTTTLTCSARESRMRDFIQLFRMQTELCNKKFTSKSSAPCSQNCSSSTRQIWRWYIYILCPF